MSDDQGDDDDWEPSAEFPGFLLWNLENRWQREQRRVLAPFELTAVQFLLLSGLTMLALRLEYLKSNLRGAVEQTR